MHAVRYTGPVELLQGETGYALKSPVEGRVLVRFDAKWAQQAYGWHSFAAEHFQHSPVLPCEAVYG